MGLCLLRCGFPKLWPNGLEVIGEQASPCPLAAVARLRNGRKLNEPAAWDSALAPLSHAGWFDADQGRDGIGAAEEIDEG